MGALGSRTRILVTHALHFLPAVDYIVCLEHGRITQEGTYAELIADQDGSFSKLVRDFGGGGQEEEKKDDAELLTEDVIDEDDSEDEAETKPLVKVKGLMQEEERATGAVGGHGSFLHPTFYCMLVYTVFTVLYSLQKVPDRSQRLRYCASFDSLTTLYAGSPGFWYVPIHFSSDYAHGMQN